MPPEDETETPPEGETETEPTAEEKELLERLAKRNILGDAGKKAIAAERARAAKAEKDMKSLQAKLDAIEADNLTENEKAIAQAKAEGRAEASGVANKRLVRAEVKAAAAAAKFSDPSDAARLLDLESFAVGDDGSVDETAITAAIAGLVESKPYLVAGATPTPPGDGDGGVRKPPPGSGTIADQIKEAEKSGDKDRALLLKTSMLMPKP